METLKYKAIKSKAQYNAYCKILEELLDEGSKSKGIQDEVDLLTILIERWDEEHNSFKEVDPIELLQSLMAERNLKAKDLADVLQVSKGLISDILNYKKGLSKDIIRRLAAYFKVSQEAFNRPYTLKTIADSQQVN